DLNPALRELVAKVQHDDPNIAGIRVGQNAPGVVRLVIDLKQAALPQVFSLTPVAAYQHRLVFDLYPATPVDPLDALIATRFGAPASAAPPAANQSPSAAAAAGGVDALEELIARHVARAAEASPAPAAAPAPPAAPPVVAAAP